MVSETDSVPEKHNEKRDSAGLVIGAHQVHTSEVVPGHANYYEKDGLRTYGDDEDHDHEPPLTLSRFMSLVAMALLWTGSQIPVYLYGGCPPYIYRDIGGTDRWTWFVIANLLALAAVCPFVGSLSDLIGRRYVALIGGCFLIVGNIICATAHTMNVFIGGMVFNGVGAGINELTALAATSEMAPTRKRGTYVSALIFTIIPFCPSVLWSQLIAYHSTWRYCGLICGVWAAIGTLLVAFFYFPPPRVNSTGLSNKEILGQIDWPGGLLSISGLVLFMAGLQWGGYMYKWHSAHVLVPLILGAILIICFFVWQSSSRNKHPMFPHRLRQNPRVLYLTLLITFISGANFFSVLMFWPTQAFNVYGHDPIGVGLRGLPIGFAIMIGACIVLVLLSITRGKIRMLMVGSTITMTAGVGALACANRDNMSTVYVILCIAGLGIGGILVPASIITTIVCPDDLIATVSALTLAIRVVGGTIGYATYYNVFYNKFVPILTEKVKTAMIQTGFRNATIIGAVIKLTGASLIEEISHIPAVHEKGPVVLEKIILAGQMAYSDAYKYVYFVSIAFGVISIVAAAFLGDIDQFMDDHVAVVIH